MDTDDLECVPRAMKLSAGPDVLPSTFRTSLGILKLQRHRVRIAL